MSYDDYSIPTPPSIGALTYVQKRLDADWRVDAQCAIENPEGAEYHLANGRKAKAVADWLTEVIACLPVPVVTDVDDDIPF